MPIRFWANSGPISTISASSAEFGPVGELLAGFGTTSARVLGRSSPGCGLSWPRLRPNFGDRSRIWTLLWPRRRPSACSRFPPTLALEFGRQSSPGFGQNCAIASGFGLSFGRRRPALGVFGQSWPLQWVRFGLVSAALVRFRPNCVGGLNVSRIQQVWAISVELGPASAKFCRGMLNPQTPQWVSEAPGTSAKLSRVGAELSLQLLRGPDGQATLNPH